MGDEPCYLKVMVSDFGDFKKSTIGLGATELIIKLRPKVVDRENFSRASFGSVEV